MAADGTTIRSRQGAPVSGLGQPARPPLPCSRTKLLEEDPALGRWLTPAEVMQARLRVVAPVLRIPRGVWRPPTTDASRRDHLGFLVLGGLLARDETLAGRTATELIGPGDLIQPSAPEPDSILVPRGIAWTALQASRLAVLGPQLVRTIEPWPDLRSALLDRAMQRCSRVSTHHALSQLSTVDARLLVLFWHLAERWGRVTAAGVLMPLRLSHEALGHLVGAKRPTVSLALARLQRDGLIVRRADRGWLLLGSAEDAVERLNCSKPTTSLYSPLDPA